MCITGEANITTPKEFIFRYNHQKHGMGFCLFFWIIIIFINYKLNRKKESLLINLISYVQINYYYYKYIIWDTLYLYQINR